jgi:hypothetical protein
LTWEGFAFLYKMRHQPRLTARMRQVQQGKPLPRLRNTKVLNVNLRKLQQRVGAQAAFAALFYYHWGPVS